MEEINRLDDKYERRMAKLEDKLNQTDIKLEKNNILTEQNTKMMEKLGDTMESVSVAMQKISYVTETLVNDMDGVKSAVEETNTRIDKIDEKSKFDIMEFIKCKVVPALIVAGTTYILAKGGL